jgi:hypothetical protein
MTKLNTVQDLEVLALKVVNTLEECKGNKAQAQIDAIRERERLETRGYWASLKKPLVILTGAE